MDEIMDGPEKLSPERLEAIKEAARIQGEESAIVFLPVAVDHPELYQRINADKRVEKFSHFAFLPMTAPLVYDSKEEAEISVLPGASRGLVAHFKHPEGEYVIKSYQSTDEKIIAPVVGELGIGPKQFPSIKNLMTEEFVKGQPLGDLGQAEVSNLGKMRQLGRKLGNHYRQLHQRNIYYNDLLADDSGRSHVMVGENGVARMIDFGVALNVSKPAEFTDEQIWNFLRTLPEMNMMAMFSMDEEQIQDLVNAHRNNVRRMTSPQIIERDHLLIRESLSYLTYQMGSQAVQEIWTGFQEEYK